MNSPPTTWHTFAALCAATVAAVSSAVELDRIFADATLTVLCAASAFLMGVVAAASAPVSQMRALVALTQALVAAAVCVAYAASYVGLDDSLSALWTGVVDGPHLAVSTSLPVEPTPDRGAFVVVLVSIGMIGACSIIVRTTVWSVAAVLLCAMHVVAVLFGVGAGGNRVVTTLVMAAAVAGIVGLRPVADHGTPARRAVYGAPLIVGLAITSAAAFSPRLPGVDHASPYDIRQRFDQADTTTVAMNPLATARGWLSADEAPVIFTLTSPVPVDVRLGVLDSYDGSDWSVRAVAEPFDRRLTLSALSPRPAGERFPVSISTLRAPAPLLPVPAGAVAVDASARMRWDRESELLLAEDGSPSVDYLVTTAPPARIGPDVARASVPRSADLTRYTTVPRLPETLEALVPTEGAVAERAQELAAMLSDGTRYRVEKRPELPPGYSLRTLERLLTARHSEGGRVGATDQFAAAFVVLARRGGVPARLVVGFRHCGGGDRAVAVRSTEVDVWGEILLDVGWIPVDSVPPSGRGPLAKGEERPAPTRTPPVTSGSSSAPSVGVTTPSPSNGTEPPPAGFSFPPWWAVLLCCAGAYLTTVLVAPPLLRHRNRSRGGSRARVERAWELALAALRRHGTAITDAMTPREVVAIGAVALAPGGGLEPLRRLAAVVETTRYTPDPVDRVAVAGAWTDAEALAAVVERQRHPVRRVVTALSVRQMATR